MFNWLPRRYYISLIFFFNEWSSRFLSEVCTSFDRRRSKLMHVTKQDRVFSMRVFSLLSIIIAWQAITYSRSLQHSFISVKLMTCSFRASRTGTNRTQSLRHEVTCHFFCSVSDRLSWMKTAWNQNYRFLAFSWRTSFMRSLNFYTDLYKRFP